MNDYKKLEQEINKIKARNTKVEADKAWETSFYRKILIVVLTYIVIVIFFYFADLSKPFINAIVPTFGFVLSILTIPVLKKQWIKRHYYGKKNRIIIKKSTQNLDDLLKAVTEENIHKETN